MTPAPLPSRPRAVGAALLVTFLWSSSWVLIRWGLDDESLEPLTFAALRYGAATVILGMWVLARPRERAERVNIVCASASKVPGEEDFRGRLG